MTEYTPELLTEVDHKKPNYILIFGVLAALTIIEVTVAADFPAILLALSAVKILLVASFYMHLKFANKWFTAIFMVPIPFVALIVVALVAALAFNPDLTSAALGICSFW
ncbi:cytochrome C oxidase subunit IV family protein [Chloroflexota bacterium]